MATVAKGHIERLPSGSYRVHVSAGRDLVTGKPRRLKRTVKTETQAAEELAKLLRAAEADRIPDDSATVGLLLDRYLDVADIEASTREAHEGYIRRTIRPVLGDVRIRKLRPGHTGLAVHPPEAVFPAVRPPAQGRAPRQRCARV